MWLITSEVRSTKTQDSRMALIRWLDILFVLPPPLSYCFDGGFDKGALSTSPVSASTKPLHSGDGD
jgi:hypothetical protein